MHKLKVEYVPISELKAYVNNAKEHPAEQIEQIKKSILEFGMLDPIGIWKDNEIIEGHGRLLACMELGEPYDVVPVIRLDHLSDEERKAYALVHNKLTMNSDFNMDLLTMELEELDSIDMSKYGFEELADAIFGTELDRESEKKGSLAEKYLVPPFSVIYGNAGKWIERKRQWALLGIKSELGRGGGLVFQLPG